MPWLYEETGVNGEDLTVRVKLNAIASLHVAVLVQVGHELVVEPTYCDEGGRVVWYLRLQVNGALEYTAVFSNIVLRVWNYSDPLAAIQIHIPDV